MKVYIELSYNNILEVDTKYISAESILYLINEAKAFKTSGWSHTNESNYTEDSSIKWGLLSIKPEQFEEAPEIDIRAVLEETIDCNVRLTC